MDTAEDQKRNQINVIYTNHIEVIKHIDILFASSRVNISQRFLRQRNKNLKTVFIENIGHDAFLAVTQKGSFAWYSPIALLEPRIYIYDSSKRIQLTLFKKRRKYVLSCDNSVKTNINSLPKTVYHNYIYISLFGRGIDLFISSRGYRKLLRGLSAISGRLKGANDDDAVCWTISIKRSFFYKYGFN